MINKPKGTKDIFGLDAEKRQYVISVWEDLMNKYHYDYIQTPVFESSEVFHRAVGETTDIVSKETYDFKDRSERGLTLRPEGTAGIVRSYVEEKMYALDIQPVKLFYNETMYRYERPQKGRYREFTQLGVEVFGSSDPAIDAEVVSVTVNYFKLLGLNDIKVRINSLGDKESFTNYRNALVDYFTPNKNSLSELSQERLNTNPMRILDSKEEQDQELIKNAPKTNDYLNQESQEIFTKVKEYLDLLEVDFVEDYTLVRGLDYYTHLVFEIEAIINGKPLAIGGGGRYDGLVELLDGPSTPAVGYAMGLDRVILALEEAEVELPLKYGIDAYLLYVNDEEKRTAIYLNQMLRMNGFRTDTNYLSKSLKSQFKTADRIHSEFYIILNSDDIKENVVTVKNTHTKEEEKVDLEYLIYYLDEHLSDEDHHHHEEGLDHE